MPQDYLSPCLFNHGSESLGNDMALYHMHLEFLVPEHYIPSDLELSRLLIEAAQKLIHDL